ASEVCRAVQHDLERVRAITKDDRSPVTVADFASQAVVAHYLTSALGPIRLVAEESSSFLRDPAHGVHLAAALEAARLVWREATPASLLDAIDTGNSEALRRKGDGAGAGGESTGFWTLDPIDGTKGFLRGHQYSVCLAYIDRGEPVLGILGCPNLPA